MAQPERNQQDPGESQRDPADSGNGKRDQSDEEAHRRADTERNVAEVGNALDGIAEEAAHGIEIRAMAEHADAVAEFQHQVVVWQQIDVTPSHVDVTVGEAAGKFQAAEWHSHDAALGREDTDVVERGSIHRDRRGRFADQLERLSNRRRIAPDEQDHIVRLDDGGRIRDAVLPAAADRHRLHAFRQALLKIDEAPSDERRVAHTDLGRLHQPVRWSGDLRFEDREIDVHAEDRSGDAKRVREAVADRSVLVSKRVENGLQCRGTRRGAREHPERFRQARGARALRSPVRPPPRRPDRRVPRRWPSVPRGS